MLMIGDRYWPACTGAHWRHATVPLRWCRCWRWCCLSGNPQVAGALRGMGAVAAGLIAATGLKLFGARCVHPLGVALCVVLGGLCFAAVALSGCHGLGPCSALAVWPAR